MKIVMTVNSRESKSLKDRLSILRRFFSNRYTNRNNIGWMLKFNNAMGFSDVEYQPVRELDGYLSWCYYKPTIYEENSYISPYKMLVLNMYFLNKEDEIVTFIVDVEDIKCSKQPKYNYNTIEMLIHFEDFLYKVLGDSIVIKLFLKKEYVISHKDWLISHMLTCLAQSEIVDNFCALDKQSKKKEVEYLYSVFKDELGITGMKFNQFYCEACKEKDPTRPYHTELEFDRKSVNLGDY